MANTKKNETTEENEILENKVEAAYEPGAWDLVDVILPKAKGLEDDVTIWVNDRSWTIQRGKHVKIPYCAYLQLDHAARMEEIAMEYEEYAQAASARHANDVLAGRRSN